MTDTTDIAALRDVIRYCSIAKAMYGTEFQVAKFKLLNVATPELLSSILDQLEAERQQREAAEKEVTYWCNLNARKNEEVAELREKLANPVMLPAGYSTRNGHPFHEGERNVMIPNKHGDWLSRFDVEHSIHVAGFTVKCGETTPQKPIISKEKLCDWLEDNFDIDDSQRDAFANCFAHNCECIVKQDGE